MENGQKALQANKMIVGFALVALLLCVFLSCASADGVYVWPVPSVSVSQSWVS